MSKLSIVIPCYNEEEVIKISYERILEVAKKFDGEYELIFVNDGSKDETLEILKEIAKINLNVKIVNFAKNFGHQIAITAGLDYATGEYIAFIDADLQDPPELILDMVILMQKEKYNVVYGKRGKRKGESIFKKVTAKAFYRILDMLSDTKIPLDTGDFRVIDKKVADVLRSLKEKDRFIRGLVSWTGFKQTSITFERQERVAGKTKYTLKKMIKLSKDGILSFSTKPLSFPIGTSIFLMIFAIVLILAFCIFNTYILSNKVIIVLMLILSAFMFLALGIMGEYVGRIYNEVRNRPLYIIAELINF